MASATLTLVGIAAVVLAVIILWKLVKLAFRIAIIVAAVAAVVWLLRQGGFI